MSPGQKRTFHSTFFFLSTSGVWHAGQAAKTSGGCGDYGLTLNYLAINLTCSRHFQSSTFHIPDFKPAIPTKFSPILTRTLVTTSNEKPITPIFPNFSKKGYQITRTSTR